MIKFCKKCNKKINRNPRYSQKQWLEIKFCSHSCAMSKRVRTKEQIEKHRQKMIGRKVSIETRKKMSLARIGRKITKESRLKQSITMKKLGIKPPDRTGTKHSEKTKKIWSINRRGKNRGSNNSLWKGDNYKRRRLMGRFEYKDWRKSVFERDNYTCQICGARNGLGKHILLNADHIKPWSLYPELRFDINNGRTLCIDCHKKTETWGHNQYTKRDEILNSWEKKI